MVRILILIAGSVLTILNTACKSKKPASQIPTYQNDSVVFYPYKSFLETQIKQVSTTPYFIYQIRTEENKRDSTLVTPEQFLAITSIFTRYSIEDTAVKRFYKEIAFNDESTHSITMSYSTHNNELPVQQVDVLLDQETQKIKRIFLTVVQQAGDSTTTYKLSWKSNASCTIAQTVSIAGGNEHSVQSAVVWNDANTQY